MFAMVLSGLGNLLTPGSEVLQEGLNVFAHKTWAGTILVSGLLAMVGAFWRDRITGLLMERIGLTTLGIVCPAYVIIVTALLGFAGVIGIALTGSIGVASLWRVVHINRELKVLRRYATKNGFR